MFRRILIVVAAVVVVTLAGHGSAQAKGPDHATISGPGIDTMRITMADPHRSLDTLLRVTSFWDGIGRTAWAAEPPAGDLGAAYTVTYHVPDLHDPGGAKPSLVQQELYPFAESGPVVHMPSGQTMYGTALAAGWLTVDRQLVDLLTELGATRTSIGPVTDPVATVAASDRDESSWPWVLAVVGAGVIALGAAALVHTRRRAGRA